MAHEQHQECIEACHSCAVACGHCASACLQEANVKELARCIALTLECAQICHYAAGTMARGSEFAQQTCQLCADICEACAEECARFNNAHCKQCAEECRRCAEACRRMAGQTQKRGSRPGVQAGAH